MTTGGPADNATPTPSRRGDALAVLVILGVALVAFVRVHLCRWITTDARLVAAALAAACLEPIWQNFFPGQIDLVLALAVSLDLLAPTRRRGRGLLTGITIGIKLTPAIFVPLLLLVGHRRAGRATRRQRSSRPRLSASW